jgi:hypothetical protein
MNAVSAADRLPLTVVALRALGMCVCDLITISLPQFVH